MPSDNYVNTEYVSPDGFDLCVICKAKTPYKSETPIDARRNYVEGCGQCCSRHGLSDQVVTLPQTRPSTFTDILLD